MSSRSVLIGAAIGLLLIVWLTMRSRRGPRPPDAVSADASDFGDVDRLMARGQYDEAARVLLETLQKNPNSERHIMKLMEVYFVARDDSAFLENALFYRKALGEQDWQEVTRMGRQVCPGEALFEEAEG